MKNKMVILLMLCLVLLSGCSEEKIIDGNANNNENIVSKETSDLKNPVLEWCQLYNPNGFDTITCVVSNPNKEDIDITYDLVFYKDGKEVSRLEQFANFQISPKHNDVIWANVDVPASKDVDEVKMENIIVDAAYNKSIDAEIKYLETIDNEAFFSVKNKELPTLNTITFFLYNDNNKNGKCDKGELVVVSTDTVFEKEGKIHFDTDVFEYTDYEIYYNAY